jgi:hypothetical protein
VSARYLPDEIVVMRGIPHTKTGKTLEVPVKRLIQGALLADVADLGAVDDPSLLEEYAVFARSRAGARAEARAHGPAHPAAGRATARVLQGHSGGLTRFVSSTLRPGFAAADLEVRLVSRALRRRLLR